MVSTATPFPYSHHQSSLDVSARTPWNSSGPARSLRRSCGVCCPSIGKLDSENEAPLSNTQGQNRSYRGNQLQLKNFILHWFSLQWRRQWAIFARLSLTALQQPNRPDINRKKHLCQNRRRKLLHLTYLYLVR